MNLMRCVVLGKPVGIWITLGFLVACIFVPLSLPPLFPHWMEFLRFGMFRELLQNRGSESLVMGIPLAVIALVGLLRRRLWGMLVSQWVFACSLSFALTFPLFSGLEVPFWIALLLTNVGLLSNRCWFDEYLH